MHDGTIYKYKLLKFKILDFVFGEFENNRIDFATLNLFKVFDHFY